MEVIAKTKYLRTSPRKLSLVARSIKGLSPTKALILLAQINQKITLPLKKTIQSALANAKNNYGLKEEELKIKKIEVNNGPIYKRIQPISRGRTHSIKKRTSHLLVVLEGGK